MYRVIGIAVLLAGSMAALVEAQGETSRGPVDEAQVRRLVAQLGSERFSEREAATRTLDTLGAAALPVLQQACKDEDAEIRRRAQELAEAIEKRLETETLLAARRCHLVYKDVPLADALKDFNDKTGANVQIDERDKGKVASRRITLDTGDVPFWEALAQFCQQAELTDPAEPMKAAVNPTPYRGNVRRQLLIRPGVQTSYVAGAGGDGRLNLVDGKPQRLPTCLAGAVRIRALPPGNGVPGGDKGLPLGLDITPEPKLQWQGVINVRIDKAVDDQGQRLSQASGFGAAGQQDPFEEQNLRLQLAAANGMPTAVRQWPILLKSGKVAARVLKELQGTVAAQVQTPPQPLLTVDNVLKADGRTIKGSDGASLKVIEAHRQANGQIKLQVQLTTSQGLALGLPRFNRGGRVFRAAGGGIMVMEDGGGAGSSALVLQDPQGKKFQLVSNNILSIAQNFNVITQEVQLTYQPQKEQGEAAQLVLNGTRTVVVEVPFTLKDVPLP